MPVEVMLIIEHKSGVLYQNQVGGTACWHPEIEGVLAPIDISSENSERMMRYTYPDAKQGISVEIADALDAILATEVDARHIKVDRARLNDSWEAWIHVTLDSSATEKEAASVGTMASWSGFGVARAVLTWPNSD